jgi:hypothetical protein
MAEAEQPQARERFADRFRIVLTLVPFVAGIATAVPLWGAKADRLFFATAAEVIALGAVAMALQGGIFRVARGGAGPAPGGVGMATILISVGVGLGFAFAALGRADGGGEPHVALTAGALAMGVAAFAIEALFGRSHEHAGGGGVA